jgi:hypothetical protein
MWLATAPADEALHIQYEFERVLRLHQMLVWNYNVQFEKILGFGLKNVTVDTRQTGLAGRLWATSSWLRQPPAPPTPPIPP